MIENTDYKNLLISVVRGEKTWNELTKHGFNIRHSQNLWEFNENPIAAIRPSCFDVARGILNLANNPRVLHEWADFLLSASALLDFSEIENNEELLGLLWDLSFESEVDMVEMLRIANSVKSLQKEN